MKISLLGLKAKNTLSTTTPEVADLCLLAKSHLNTKTPGYRIAIVPGAEIGKTTGNFDEIWPEEFWETMLQKSLPRITEQIQLKMELQNIHSIANSAEELLKKIEADTELAANLHRKWLPNPNPEIPGVRLALKFIAGAGKGGDYFDVFEIVEKKQYGILMASGKSHTEIADLLSFLLKIRPEEFSKQFSTPKEFVAAISKDLPKLDLLFAILDRSTLTLTVETSGNLPFAHWRNQKRLQTTALKPGDLILFHTNGLLNIVNSKEVDQIIETKKELQHPLEIQQELLGKIDHFRSKTTIPSDITLLLMQVDEKALYLKAT